MSGRSTRLGIAALAALFVTLIAPAASAGESAGSWLDWLCGDLSRIYAAIVSAAPDGEMGSNVADCGEMGSNLTSDGEMGSNIVHAGEMGSN